MYNNCLFSYFFFIFASFLFFIIASFIFIFFVLLLFLLIDCKTIKRYFKKYKKYFKKCIKYYLAKWSNADNNICSWSVNF